MIVLLGEGEGGGTSGSLSGVVQWLQLHLHWALCGNAHALGLLFFFFLESCASVGEEIDA